MVSVILRWLRGEEALPILLRTLHERLTSILGLWCHRLVLTLEARCVLIIQVPLEIVVLLLR